MLKGGFLVSFLTVFFYVWGIGVIIMYHYSLAMASQFISFNASVFVSFVKNLDILLIFYRVFSLK